MAGYPALALKPGHRRLLLTRLGPVSRQADPGFNDEFTWCNYITKYYTLGVCGLCGMKVKRWVDASIVMGEPKFDEDMAEEDAAADAANPNEMNRRYTNQSMSGPPGFQDPNRAVSFSKPAGPTPFSSPGVEMHLLGKQAQAGSSVEMSPRYKAQQAAGKGPQVGKPVSKSKFCTECGAQFGNGKFCSECGARRDGNDSLQEPSQEGSYAKHHKKMSGVV